MKFVELFFISISINIANCYFLDCFLPNLDTWPSFYDEPPSHKESINFVKRVQSFGYTAEEHIVVNKDGYNLKLHRISGSPKYPEASGKKVILLQHGLMMQSTNFILQGPKGDLAFLLADRGYDVWLGNARGNALSRSNNNISPSNSSFWDFSYHEIGLDDIPTFIDEILKRTKQNKLTYIGYSMGTTEIFVLLSSKPEYNRKVNLVVQLAPIAFWKHNSKPLIESSSQLLQLLNENVLELTEILDTPLSESTECVALCCVLNKIIHPVFDEDRHKKSTIADFKKTFPAGTSVKSLIHFMQNIETGLFTKYDYGEEENLDIYRTEDPPEYSLEKITVPVALYYGNGDKFTTDKDINLLKRELTRAKSCNVTKIEDDKFNHLDFVLSNVPAKTLLYEEIVGLIENIK